MRKTLSVCSVALPLLLSGTVFAATPAEQSASQLLNTSRQYIKFPAYSDAEKQTIADQAKNLLSVYVNRENKKLLYGADVDAIPRIDAVQKQATAMTDEALHYSIQDIFESQRDLHLNYSYPNPHGCFIASQLFSLQEIYSPTLNRKAVISQVLSSFTPLVPQLAQLSIGDEVVSINGQTLRSTIDNLTIEGAGANNFGSFKRALAKITFRSFSSDKVPSKNEEAYTFKRASDGSLYTIALPWLTQGNEECIADASTGATGASPSAATGVIDPLVAMSARAEDPYQKLYNEHFGLSVNAALAKAGVTINDSADSTIKWAIINNRYGRYAYLSLSSMVPESGIVGGAEIISNLLTNELAQTDGLILDVRNNGGGFVVYAEILPQLFSAQLVEPYKKRALRADLNELIFVDLGAEGPQWQDTYQEIIGTDSTYTRAIELTPKSFANDFMGQLYFKPVALLTNAACYSACDLISGLMQDFSDATLWGEDLLTGAGGANVIGFNSAFIDGFRLDTIPGSGIERLPGGQDMRVAWRQTIRTGESENRVIEDLGVSVERRARPRVSDLQGSSNSQLDRITADLDYESSSKQSAIKFYSPGRFVFDSSSLDQLFLGYEIDVVNGSSLKTNIQVVDTDRVNVYVNGTKVGSVNTYGSGRDGRDVVINMPNNTSSSGKQLLKLEGVKFGDVVWRVNRLINVK